MRVKKKNLIFLCQITENVLKVIKCLCSNNAKREFVGLEVEAIHSDINDKELSERLNRVFKRLGYSNNPIIISLPCEHATCRYLKVPAQASEEIEKIVYLQAPRYLPYQADELTTGYQTISSDNEGYSYINMIIVTKPVIERYIKIFKELKITKLAIAMSSYGLCNFYYYIKPEDPDPVMVIDIDSNRVELAIISRKKLLFSRCFKFNRAQDNWEDLLIEEINKTHNAYLKEISKETLRRIIILGANKNAQELAKTLNKKAGLPIEILSYDKRVNFSENLLNRILDSDNSLVSLIGLGIGDVEESLNLLPQDTKEALKKMHRTKERLQLILFIFGIILILGIGMVKSLDNKTKYLKQLRVELNKIEKDAKLLGEIDKRLQLLETRLKKRPSSLEILYELHQVIPNEVSLINLNYEEDNQVILRGQATELNSAFKLVLQLEKSLVFKNFNIKVRYASKRNTQTGEIVDFEIVCLKEK
ncbi:MAG: hypothetical protein FJZ16_04715 [Candidatus Omnitrophica bacterium]|nr:hypothetical protein [Candidatus Omnitrophota bacterium]